VAFRCFCRGKLENGKCLALIPLYKSEEVLWNSKSANYRNRSKREGALKHIGDEMRMPVQDLKEKMTTLLASYRREKSRIKKSHVTGSGTNILIKLLVYHS
jgi:hypothetical protein